MVVRQRFPIKHLAARTGVPPATIHHYLRLGLLPPPRRVARNRFLYDERHAQGLRLIKVLRERRKLHLAEIRRILPELLSLEAEQAFRPEMWDRVAAVQLRTASKRAPGSRLLEAARDAFARRGYADVNVDEICKAARIAKGSFYRHYRSKEELFFAAAEAAAAEAAAAFRRETRRAGRDSGALLATVLQPSMPIFLDLIARALQRRPGYRRAAGRIFRTLARETGGSEALLEKAFGRAVRPVLRGPTLAGETQAHA